MKLFMTTRKKIISLKILNTSLYFMTFSKVQNCRMWKCGSTESEALIQLPQVRAVKAERPHRATQGETAVNIPTIHYPPQCQVRGCTSPHVRGKPVGKGKQTAVNGGIIM